MAGGGSSSSSTSNAPKARKRVEVETPGSLSLRRAKDGSGFVRCEECNSSVPVALIDMHNCSLEAKIKMSLEAQVMEMPAETKKKPAETKKKPAERKKSSSSSSSEPKLKKRKLTKSKDPNMPKRPVTAFFLFMEDFRKTYKEEHPEKKGGAVVAKEGGEKWKSMTEEEKQAYIDRAAELKAEYEKAMETYQADDGDEAGDDQPEELCDEDA
ncbi:hypothetical protein Droror1_Dr00002801 [Drosera rotundifolia]